MRAIAADVAENANQRPATCCGRSRNFLRRGSVVMQTARGLFPSKTARHLSGITGDPVRTWEYWLSKERLPGEALGALFQSEHGLAFLDALCSGSPWWRKVRRALAAAEERDAMLNEAADVFHRLAARSAPETADSLRAPNVAGASACAMASPSETKRRTT